PRWSSMPAGGASHQRVLSDRCAILSRLRHPLINPLIDYGALDSHHLFEVTGVSAARPAGGSGLRLMSHLARFLESHAVPLAADTTARTIRQVSRGGAFTGRPVGIVLQ